MFRNAYQSGFFSIFFSIGSKPLELWSGTVRNGFMKRITDDDIQSLALEISSVNGSTTFIRCPARDKVINDDFAVNNHLGYGSGETTLGIRLPFIVIIVKNLHKPFIFEIEVIDDKHIRRRFRASTCATNTRVKPFECSMPMRLDDGWNQIQFNLSDFVRRAYGTNYLECCSVQIHANCRLRRIYFSDRLYSEEELPRDFRLLMPIRSAEEPVIKMVQGQPGVLTPAAQLLKELGLKNSKIGEIRPSQSTKRSSNKVSVRPVTASALRNRPESLSERLVKF